MVYFYNNLQKILTDKIEELIKLGCNPSEILLLTLNGNAVNNFDELTRKNVQVKSFDAFVRDILKKSQIGNLNVISDFIAIQIIYSVSKKEMEKNSALKNLSKSISFSRELYNLFGIFKVNRVSVEELSAIASSEGLATEDKNRFEIIISVFKKYINFLRENNLSDYRDIVLQAISVFNSNDILKSNFKSQYKNVFVYGAQDLTPVQSEFLNLLSEKIELFADKNASVQGFQGATSLENAQNVVLSDIERNQDIFKRALFIADGISFVAEKSDAVQYRLFDDFKEETDYIAEDIVKELEKGTKPCDLAIITRDNSIKQKFIDVLKLYSIPVNTGLYSEEYLLFKYRFNRILNMFEIFEKFSLKEFNFKNFFNIEYSSLVEKEILAEQLNLYVQNIMFEIFANKYSLKTLCSIKERNGDLFLLETAFKNQDMLPEDDKKKLIFKVSEINKLYQAYLSNDYIKIVVELAEIFKSEDENYNKFIAKFLMNLKQLIELKINILNEKIDCKTLSDLADMTLEENSNINENVNLLTCFRASEQTFKKVYIPSMVDEYFPKKSKWTYFVSNSANDFISNELMKNHSGIGKLIKSSREEFQDEERMFYVALNCATEQVLVSAHKYENKKQIQASSFFEQLMFADCYNFVSDDIEKYETEKELVKVNNTADNGDKNELEKVIKCEDILSLSASSISTFLKCPKQFYFKHVLRLKEKDNFASSYGTFVHAIFELLLNKYLTDFSKEKALELGEILFNVKKDAKKVLDTGFKKDLIENVKSLSDMEICEMKENFTNAIKSLGDTYFEEKPTEVFCETRFEFFAPEFEKVKFSGFIDLIARYKNGYRIVDYKTGHDKTRLDKLICESGVNFMSNAGRSNACFSESKVKSYEYQIPLYYFACLNAPELSKYKDEIYDMGYQYVRPDYKENGSKTDFIVASNVEEFKDKIIENIKTYVVDKIREKSEFEACFDEFNCKYCQFSDICDIENDREGSDD